ncbi:hypothetical protein ACFQE1_06830 [Halobium palmae]|uniref:Uncharacterized protein n=1 Tax=Halobium palmae TaxID=1776492 RepID=A0ABD5RYU7_9EURY
MDQFGTFMSMMFDDFGEFFEGVLEGVIALPPEERFTRSHEVVIEQIREEFGTEGAFAAQFAQFNDEQIPNFVRQLNQKLITDLVRGIYFHREADIYLILAALVQTSDNIVGILEGDFDQDVKEVAYSSMMALWCRLVHEIRQGEEPPIRELALDIYRARYYVNEAMDDSAVDVETPDHLPEEKIEQEMIEFGAAIAYKLAKISVGRGAELAGLREREFRKRVLPAYGIEPRTGPRSADELGEPI